MISRFINFLISRFINFLISGFINFLISNRYHPYIGDPRWSSSILRYRIYNFIKICSPWSWMNNSKISSDSPSHRMMCLKLITCSRKSSWMMNGYFGAHDASMIDGCGDHDSYWNVHCSQDWFSWYRGRVWSKGLRTEYRRLT